MYLTLPVKIKVETLIKVKDSIIYACIPKIMTNLISIYLLNLELYLKLISLDTYKALAWQEQLLK